MQGDGSGANNVLSTAVHVYVEDVDDNDPVFDNPEYVLSVLEEVS